LVGFAPAATALEPLGVLMFAGWLVWHAATTKPACQSSQPLADVRTTEKSLQKAA
jgi:hypothetical protein